MGDFAYVIRVVSVATPNEGKGISGATDREIYECLSASFPAFYLVVSGKKRHFAAKLDIELNGWRMKQYGKRYEPESGDVDFEYHHIIKGLYATFSSWHIDHSTFNNL